LHYVTGPLIKSSAPTNQPNESEAQTTGERKKGKWRHVSLNQLIWLSIELFDIFQLSFWSVFWRVFHCIKIVF